MGQGWAPPPTRALTMVKKGEVHDLTIVNAWTAVRRHLGGEGDDP
ncbi:hypothetical protein QE379_003882 [Sphingomonas sp. SORGH_AS 879]|nr:hypothetical protein [Sphingomonas sp. SORGH_AS_0879]